MLVATHNGPFHADDVMAVALLRTFWDAGARVDRSRDPARHDAADVVVLKVAPLGGVRACLRLVEQTGLPVVVSSALETSVGLAAGLALAAGVPELPYACGLATAQLLAGDVVPEPLLPRDGELTVRSPAPGPSPELLATHAADPALTARWSARLDAVTGRVA